MKDQFQEVGKNIYPVITHDCRKSFATESFSTVTGDYKPCQTWNLERCALETKTVEEQDKVQNIAHIIKSCISDRNLVNPVAVSGNAAKEIAAFNFLQLPRLNYREHNAIKQLNMD